MGLSFWLVDSRAKSAKDLAPILELMAQLENDVEGSSDRFDLHATLLAGVKKENGWGADKAWKVATEAAKAWKAGQGVSEQGKISCRFHDVVTRGFFFQCILIALDAPQSLHSLNDAMRKAFSLESQPAYFPHLSLLYAGLTTEQAEAKIDSLRSSGLVKPVDGPGGAGKGNVEVKGVSSVDLDELQLWNTNGGVAEWRCLHAVKLVVL